MTPLEEITERESEKVERVNTFLAIAKASFDPCEATDAVGEALVLMRQLPGHDFDKEQARLIPLNRMLDMVINSEVTPDDLLSIENFYRSLEWNTGISKEEAKQYLVARVTENYINALRPVLSAMDNFQNGSIKLTLDQYFGLVQRYTNIAGKLGEVGFKVSNDDRDTAVKFTIQGLKLAFFPGLYGMQALTPTVGNDSTVSYMLTSMKVLSDRTVEGDLSALRNSIYMAIDVLMRMKSGKRCTIQDGLYEDALAKAEAGDAAYRIPRNEFQLFSRGYSFVLDEDRLGLAKALTEIDAAAERSGAKKKADELLNPKLTQGITKIYHKPADSVAEKV